MASNGNKSTSAIRRKGSWPERKALCAGGGEIIRREGKTRSHTGRALFRHTYQTVSGLLGEALQGRFRSRF